MTVIDSRRTARRPLAAKSQDATQVVSVAAAGVGLFLLGFGSEVIPGVPVTAGLALVLSPALLSGISRHRGAQVLLVAAVIAAAGGLLLIALNPYGHRFALGSAVAQLGLVLSLPLVTLFVLWARRLIEPGTIVAVVGFGMLLAVDPTAPLYDSNPWRFGYSVPVALVLLGLAQRSGNRPAQLTVLLLLAGITATSDARSGLGILAMAILLFVLQFRPRPKNPRVSALLLVLAGAVLAWFTYSVGQQLILGGALGSATEDRSAAQIQAAGNLLLGGRPELGASAALFLQSPLGFGPGAVPSPTDVHTAQAGMLAIGYYPYNGYVYNYMFGGSIQLHSTVADLWAIGGVAGLLLAAVILFALIRGTALAVASGTCGAAVLFLAVRSLWNVGFSPLAGTLVMLAVALALVIPERRNASARSARGRAQRAAEVRA